MFTPPQHVTCNVSHITGHVSHVMCHMSDFLNYFFWDIMVKLIGGGSVFNGAYPTQFEINTPIKRRLMISPKIFQSSKYKRNMERLYIYILLRGVHCSFFLSSSILGMSALGIDKLKNYDDGRWMDLPCIFQEAIATPGLLIT